MFYFNVKTMSYFINVNYLQLFFINKKCILDDEIRTVKGFTNPWLSVDEGLYSGSSLLSARLVEAENFD